MVVAPETPLTDQIHGFQQEPFSGGAAGSTARPVQVENDCGWARLSWLLVFVAQAHGACLLAEARSLPQHPGHRPTANVHFPVKNAER